MEADGAGDGFEGPWVAADAGDAEFLIFGGFGFPAGVLFFGHDLEEQAGGGFDGLAIEGDEDDVGEVEIAGDGEVREFGFAEDGEVARDTLSGWRIDGEGAAAVIEKEFAGGAANGAGGVIDGFGGKVQVDSGAVGEEDLGTADVVEEGIEGLAGFVF